MEAGLTVASLAAIVALAEAIKYLAGRKHNGNHRGNPGVTGLTTDEHDALMALCAAVKRIEASSKSMNDRLGTLLARREP